MFSVGWVLFSFLGLFSCAGVGLYLLHKDRELWRTQFLELQSYARTREEFLFDQLLIAKQVRPIHAPQAITPQRETIMPLAEDEVESYQARIQERIQHGMLSAGQGFDLLSNLRTGKLTKAELDRELWQASSRLNGSVMEF